MNVRLSLECNNPTTTAGTVAAYAGTDLSTCLSNDTQVGETTGGAAALEFAANVPSKAAVFDYPDVGIVTLRMRDSTGNIAKTTFASVPRRLGAQYKRADGVLNPGTADLALGAFAEAGEPFLAVVTAYGQDDKTPLPNFGRESGAYALAGVLELVADGDELEQNLLQQLGDWSGTGSLTRTYAWNEAGLAMLTPSLPSYLGVDGTKLGAATPVGRFYPQYFKTETGGGFGCLPRMACPVDAPHLVSKAVFSGQEFGATVQAYGRNGPLQRFDPLFMTIPDIALSAVSLPGPDGAALSKFVDAGPATSTARRLRYALGTPFKAGVNNPGWSPPTAVHVRATAQELRKTLDGTQAVAISSLRDKTIVSVEGGIHVVNGRLMVGNVIGAGLSKTPLPLRAEYWSGSNWEYNKLFEQGQPINGTVEFSACRRSLRESPESDTCYSGITVFGAAAGAATVELPPLQGGKSTLVLAPVGQRSGTVDVSVNGELFLPSTLGRVTFGQFKSPVIYVREMY